MTPENVSRETQEYLNDYLAELLKWNARINLIGRSTAADAATRHIVDSVQVVKHAPPDPALWCDLGSGGGLPVVVGAILRRDTATRFIAIESDQRKATFLRHIARHLNLALDVRANRIEDVPSVGADVMTARALAPLKDLLPYTLRHGQNSVTALFPKGASYGNELDEAKRYFRFACRIIPSVLAENSVILHIKDIQHV